MTTKKLSKLRELKEQLNDQENRASRQNLRLVGFSEGVEGRNTVAFIQEWLPKILDLEGELLKLNVDTSHCNNAKQTAPDPVPMWSCSSTFQTLSRSSMQSGVSLQYGNSIIMIFRDMSTALYKKRKAFAPLKRKLKEKNINFRLLHPTTFTMDLEGGRRTFTTPQAAENYLRKYHPDVLPQD